MLRPNCRISVGWPTVYFIPPTTSQSGLFLLHVVIRPTANCWLIYRSICRPERYAGVYQYYVEDEKEVSRVAIPWKSRDTLIELSMNWWFSQRNELANGLWGEGNFQSQLFLDSWCLFLIKHVALNWTEPGFATKNFPTSRQHGTGGNIKRGCWGETILDSQVFRCGTQKDPTCSLSIIVSVCLICL